MSYVGTVTVGSDTHLVGATLYGTCSTAANTAAKVVNCPNFDTIVVGVMIAVKFSNGNTATSPTMNVNNTGAKNILIHGITSLGGLDWSISEGDISLFVYDGTAWNLISAADRDTLNQVGSANSTSKMYLVGAEYQTANGGSVVGKSNANVYATNGALHATSYNGYTLGAACEKSVGSVASGNTGLVTGGDVYTAIANAASSSNSFKGSLGSSTSTATYTQSTLQSAAYKAGWVLVVNSAGTYVGHVCEVGDMVYCVSDKDSAYAASDFTVVQNEMDVLTNTEIDAIVNS